jgi:hypothetical protein
MHRVFRGKISQIAKIDLPFSTPRLYGGHFGLAYIGNGLDWGPDYKFGQVFGTPNDPRNIQFSLELMF